jgi:hypothetical protein
MKEQLARSYRTPEKLQRDVTVGTYSSTLVKKTLGPTTECELSFSGMTPRAALAIDHPATSLLDLLFFVI